MYPTITCIEHFAWTKLDKPIYSAAKPNNQTFIGAYTAWLLGKKSAYYRLILNVAGHIMGNSFNWPKLNKNPIDPRKIYLIGQLTT